MNHRKGAGACNRRPFDFSINNLVEEVMKLSTLAPAAVLLSSGYAMAGAGAPVPEGSQNPLT